VFSAARPRSPISCDEKARGATIQRHIPTFGQIKSLDHIPYATKAVVVHQLLKVGSCLVLCVGEALTMLLFHSAFFILV
jgi:hypothetical protein